MTMQPRRVFISTSSFAKYSEEPILLLKRAGFEVEINPNGRQLTEAEIREFLKEKQVIGLIAGTEPLTESVLMDAKELKLISRCGTGLDNVDMEAADRLGIKVYNTPDAPTNAVAELTVGLILDCLRRISSSDRSIRSGKWNKSMGGLLGAKTVGIVGYGRIGRAVARLVRAFGAEALAFDITPPLTNPLPLGERVEVRRLTGEVAFVPFEELLSRADIVTLHLTYSPDLGKTITKDTIAKMKDGAYLINTSRGALVDEGALYDALNSGKLAGAALDVFEIEPYNGDLVNLDNVVLTTHIGSYAREARIAMENEAAENILKGFRETGVM